MPRFTPIAQRILTAEQHHIVEEVRSGRRGTVPANVVAWLPSPELARRAAHLGEFVRYETSLPARLTELAILIVARRWSCAYEWAVHAVEAAKAGIPEETIADIARGLRPALTGDDAVVFEASCELVDTGRWHDATHVRVSAALGETGLTELVGVVGYYTLVAFTLNAHDAPVPPGAPVLPALPT